MEWISMIEAVNRLGGGKEWFQIIAHRAQAGVIRSQADAYLINGERQGDGPEPIPPFVWRIYNLEGTWRSGDFRGGGNPFAEDASTYEIFGAKFSAEDVASLMGSAAEVMALHVADPGAEEKAAEPMVSDRAGGPGAPSSMHIIKALMEQRAVNGVLEGSLSLEADALLSAFTADPRYSALRAPTKKTVTNQLGAAFRRAHATQNNAQK